MINVTPFLFKNPLIAFRGLTPSEIFHKGSGPYKNYSKTQKE
jgi:hypothetical protein